MFPDSTGQSDLYTTAIFPGTQGWVKEFFHLPAALPSGLPRKVFISPTQRRKKSSLTPFHGIWSLTMKSHWNWGSTPISAATARHCLWLGPPWLKHTAMYPYIIKRFQSKTLPQQMHWGRGQENKQEPDVCLIPSWTEEGSRAVFDESLCILELHEVPQGTTAQCYHSSMWTLNIFCLEWHCSVWFHQKKNFLGFKSLAPSLDCGKSWGINAVEKLGKGTYVKHCTSMRGLLPHHPSLLKDNLVIRIPCFCAQQCFFGLKLSSGASATCSVLALRWNPTFS